MALSDFTEEAKQRQRALHQWHVEWTAKHQNEAVFDSEKSKPGSDYNLHFLDVDPPGDSGWEFHQATMRIQTGPWPPVDADLVELVKRVPRVKGTGGHE